jgi:hypothetical protein
MTYNVDIEYAMKECDNYNFTDEKLKTYNAIRYIIGNKLACHYILDDDFFPLPDNFIDTIRKLLDIGVEDIKVIDKILEKPIEERDASIHNIFTQLKTFGFIDFNLF